MAFSGMKNGVLTLDPGVGDTTTTYNVNGVTAYTEGVDTSAADSFVVAHAAALGVNDVFIMNAQRQRTLPSQPAFLAIIAWNSAFSWHNIGESIGNRAASIIVANRGGGLAAGGGGSATTFTAPARGLYFMTITLHGTLYRGGGGGAAQSPEPCTYCTLVTTARTYRMINQYNWAEERCAATLSPSWPFYQSSSLTVPLNVGDTAYYRIYNTYYFGASPIENGYYWANGGYISGYLTE